MSSEPSRHPITLLPAVYRIERMDEVTVRHAEYRQTATGPLTMDLYDPPDAIPGGHLPAVIFVTGFPDPGFEARLGCRQMEMASYVSWARLVAASGMTAITYSNLDPAADALAVLRYVRANAAALRVDGSRIGIWSSSGNVPTALSLLMQEPLACAVLCYGFLLDLDGSSSIADAQKQWGFANPSAGRSIADIPGDRPILIARAERDETPGLNEAIDRFAAHALAANLSVTVVNHESGPHAFDLHDDGERTREIIRGIVAFLQVHLS